MIEFLKTINTFVANLIGSFNPDDAILIYLIFFFILFICSIVIKGNLNKPNPYFLTFASIPGILALCAILTVDDNTTPYHIDTYTNNLTTRFEKTDTYTAFLSESNANNTILTLNSYVDKPKVKAKDLPVPVSANEATVYFKVNGSPAGKETYTLPTIVENFTSKDAKTHKTELTPEVTKVEENNLTITVTSNNLKKEKTVKSAVIYVTYDATNKNKETIQQEKDHQNKQTTNPRDELRRIANNDSYWK